MTPRQAVHRGAVRAAAFLLDPSLIGAETVRQRARALWGPGVHLSRLDDGALVVHVAEPAMVRTDRAPGLPLTDDAGVLCAFPLDPELRRQIAPPAGAVVRMWGGAVRVEPSAAVDPAELLDVDGFVCVAASGLGAPPPPPAAAVVSPLAPRQALGIGEAPAARKETLAALQKALDRAPVKGARLSRTLAALALAPLSLLARLLGGAAPPRDASSAPPRPSKAPPAFLSLLQDRLARLVLRTGLGARLARQHARYLQKMVELFERGDWDDALRHAIPLGRVDADDAPLSLGQLRPRESLSIRPEHTASGSGLPWGGLYENLNALYRRAFDKLVEAGRIEEAAFVLSELLQADEEAVAFLEKHGRLRLAAEMAEARALAAGLVVRQWWIAGERERAVAAARRTGAFADAVARLERTDPEAAATLRHLWARHLAATGNFAGAVEAAWKLDAAASERVGWVRKAVAVGGTVGARMLARQAALDGPTDGIDALWTETGIDAPPRRRHFTQELVQLAPFPGRERLARRALRALLADAGDGAEVPRGLVREAADAAESPALRADLPTLPPWRPPPAFDPPLDLRVLAGDTGDTGATDAALLPDGRMLVALGELGALLLGRDGRTLAAFDRPAHHLIVSDHGDRAILAARRGENWRLSRLDLTARKATDWTDARLATFPLFVDDLPPAPAMAQTYDGSTWLVALEDGLYALDALAEGLSFLWRYRELPGPVVRLHRSEDGLEAIVGENAQDGGVDFQRWRYELPSLTLRHRSYRDRAECLGPLALPSHGILDLGPYGDPPRLSLLEEHGQTLTLDAPGRVPLRLAGDPSWAVAILRERDGVTAHLVRRDALRRAWDESEPPRAVLRLDGATDACARIADGVLTLADSRGRVLVLDLATGRLRRDLRLRI